MVKPDMPLRDLASLQWVKLPVTLVRKRKARHESSEDTEGPPNSKVFGREGEDILARRGQGRVKSRNYATARSKRKTAHEEECSNLRADTI